MLQKDGPCDKSPLQMLAQTCSQIGADPGPAAAKPSTAAAGDKGKAAAGARKGGGSPTIVVTDAKPVPFKPYESSKEVTAKPVDSKRASESGSAKSASPHFDSRCVDTSTAGRMLIYFMEIMYSISYRLHISVHWLLQVSKRTPKHGGKPQWDQVRVTKELEQQQVSSGGWRRLDTSYYHDPLSSDPASTTPIMSTGLEILAGAGAGAGHPKDLPLGAQFRPPAPGHGLLDLNPAFRLPSSIPGLPGYPAPAPMVSSAGGGAPCRDPYCKDPSCPTFVYNAYLASARLRLPPGYLELLEAHKLASLGAVSAAGPASSPPAALPPSPSLPPTSLAASASLGPGKPRRAVSAAADLTPDCPQAAPTSATGWRGATTAASATAARRSCWSTSRPTPTSPPRTWRGRGRGRGRATPPC